MQSVAVLMHIIDAEDLSHIGSVIEILAKFIVVHFSTAEALMRSCSHPFYDDRKSQHVHLKQIRT